MHRVSILLRMIDATRSRCAKKPVIDGLPHIFSRRALDKDPLSSGRVKIMQERVETMAVFVWLSWCNNTQHDTWAYSKRCGFGREYRDPLAAKFFDAGRKAIRIHQLQRCERSIVLLEATRRTRSIIASFLQFHLQDDFDLRAGNSAWAQEPNSSSRQIDYGGLDSDRARPSVENQVYWSSRLLA